MAKEIVAEDLQKVSRLLLDVLGVGDYKSIERMGGLTNHTYHVVLENGKEYVVRIPGEGTEELIVRSDEMVSTRLACRLGVDANMLYFGKDGAKVTEYIPNAVTMSAELLAQERHIEQVAEIFRIMHGCGEDAHIRLIDRCMQDGVIESIAPLLVQFGSYRKSDLIEPVTCEQMADRYKKEGI